MILLASFCCSGTGAVNLISSTSRLGGGSATAAVRAKLSASSVRFCSVFSCVLLFFHERDRIDSEHHVRKNEHRKSDRNPAAKHRTAFFKGWLRHAKDLARVAHIGVNLTGNRQLSPQLRVRHEPLFQFRALARR